MKYLAPQEIFHDPRSPEQELAAETLRYKINHPFSDAAIFRTKEAKPIRPIKTAELISIGHSAVGEAEIPKILD